MSYIDDLSGIWEEIKQSLKNELPQTIIDLWIAPLNVHSFEDNAITLEAKTELSCKIAGERYIPLIARGFSEMLGFEPEVRIVFMGEKTSVEDIKRQIHIEKEEKAEEHVERPFGMLPQNYNFEYTLSKNF